MSPTEDDHQVHTFSFTRAIECFRLLEAPDRQQRQWHLVGFEERVVGTFENLKAAPFRLEVDKGLLEGEAFRASYVYWKWRHAMRWLQGSSPQQLFGPNYLFFTGRVSPWYSSRPHIRQVGFALIKKAPTKMRLEEAVYLLHANC